MLFAIDDYNFFMDYTVFKFGNLSLFDVELPRKIHASEFTLVRALNKLMVQNSVSIEFGVL